METKNRTEIFKTDYDLVSFARRELKDNSFVAVTPEVMASVQGVAINSNGVVFIKQETIEGKDVRRYCVWGTTVDFVIEWKKKIK